MLPDIVRRGMTWMYIKASTQCDGSFLVAFVQGNVAVFPSLPPKLRFPQICHGRFHSGGGCF